MFKLFSFLLFVCLVNYINAQCGEFGTFNDGLGLCVCESGYTGSSCDVNSVGSCSFPTPQPLLTLPIGSVEVGNLSSNAFSLTVVGNPVYGRTVNSIILGTTYSDGCAYPSAGFSHTFDSVNCADNYASSINFQVLVSQCQGFDLTVQNSVSSVYSGRIYISLSEYLGTYHSTPLTRSISSSLGLQVILPTSVTVNATVSAFYPPTVAFFITSQSYDATSGTATIEVSSVAPYPYYLTSSVLNSQPDDITSAVGISVDSPSCITATSGDCVQVVTLTIALNAACDFSGTYSFNSSISCRTGSSCESESLPPADSLSSTSLSISADNVCSFASVYASLTGNLATYTDDSYQTEVNTYIIGDTVYAQIFLSSDITLSDITINNLNLQVNSTDSVVLVASQDVSQAGNNADLAINSPVLNSGTGGSITFQFLLSAGTSSSDVFQTSETSFSFTFSIIADINIQYVTDFGKRSLETQSLNIQQQIFTQSKKTKSSYSSDSPKLSFSIILAILPLIASLLFAF